MYATAESKLLVQLEVSAEDKKTKLDGDKWSVDYPPLGTTRQK